MLMLMPDARFDGVAEFEQAVVGERAEVRVYQADSLDDISSEISRASHRRCFFVSCHAPPHHQKPVLMREPLSVL